jgi:predicted RNase H-like HicB family nuclease
MINTEEYEHYSVIMEWDPVDRIYVVTVPELPGCMTHGATLEEAARQARDAIESWIDVAREDNIPLPTARYYDLECESYIDHRPDREPLQIQKAS